MDKDRIKQFFVNNVEKIVLGVVAAFSVLLLFSGFSQESYDKTSPTTLAQEARDVKLGVDEDHNETVVQPRKLTVASFPIVERTKLAQKELDPTPYSLSHSWERQSADSSIKRLDPTLAKPFEVLVSAEARILGMRSKTGEYSLPELEEAEELEKIERKVKKVKKKKEPVMDMYGGDMDMAEGDMYGGEMDMGGEDMYAGMGGSMASSANRKYSSDADFGAGVQSTKNVITDASEEVVPQWSMFIAGTCAVPHKKIYDAYKAAFLEASGFNQARDLPVYNNYEVQRADVTEKTVDQLTDADWVKVADRLSMSKVYASTWSGFSPEPVDEFFRDPALTTWIPPVLLDDYRDFAFHPLVPITKDDDVLVEEKDVDPADFDNLRLKKSGEVLSSGGDMYGGGDDMYGGDMGMGGDDMYGGGGGMYGGGGPVFVETEQPDVKLMRFFDFFRVDNRLRDPRTPSPELGRTYVYRVRVGLEDPNFPERQESQPKLKTIDPSVYPRIEKLVALAKETDTRTSQIWTDWSEPSAPVALPDAADAFVGPVTDRKAKDFRIGNRTVRLNRETPKVKMVLRGIDFKYSGYVPTWETVGEGSVLAKKMESGEIVDPITMEVRKLPDATIRSQATVISIQGGDEFSIVDSKEEIDLVTPSQVLMFDGDGTLRVSGEVSDQEEYRAWGFLEDRGL